MAQHATTPLTPPPPRRSYPWAEWMALGEDGRPLTWELVEGEDFAGDAEAFRNRCYAMGSKHGLKATVAKSQDDDGRTLLRVCFYDHPAGTNGAGEHAAA